MGTAGGQGRASAPFVATKLEPPPLPPTYSARERVAALFSTGSAEACQLTLVSAPPGYGKTMAVRGWLASQDRPYAWLTLDEGDGEPIRLVRYLTSALRRVRPELSDRAAGLFAGTGTPAIDFVVATLLDEVASSVAPFILVLDDYHLLGSQVGQALVGLLIVQAPPFAQVVLATRQDPRLPLARLRANGRLVELRADELRYTHDEAVGLLAALDVRLPPTALQALMDRTEGWAAGLQLAALMLRGRPDPEVLLASFGASHRYVIDYLGDEVMERLPDELRVFVERTSVSERLCSGLADALTDGTDSERVLHEIEARNLFLLPVAASGHWYRYHNLFADYLRDRLPDEERRQLQFQAAEWCSGQGLIVEATGYALASERWPAALSIVAAGSRAALEAGEPNAVMRWTDAVPPASLASSPDLLADRAWAAYMTGQMSAALASAAELAALDEAGGLSGPAAARGRGIRAWLAVLDCRPEEGERLARIALESLSEDPFFRELTLLALSNACWNLGQVDENTASVTQALALARDRPPTYATYLAAFLYAVGCAEQGRRPEAERECRDLVKASIEPSGRVAPLAGPLRVGLGMLAYEANDLTTAAAELEAGFAMSRRVGMDSILGGQARRARVMTRLAMGDADVANRAVQEDLVAAQRFLPRTRLPSAEAVAALVGLRTGELRRALSWADQILREPERPELSTPLVRLHRDLTVARVMLAAGSAARAEAIAMDARQLALWTGSVLGQIEAEIVCACAAEHDGRRGAARSRLGAAISLAAPGGYVRRFVEDAASIAHLLPTVRLGAEDFVDAVTNGLNAEARPAPGRSSAGTAWRAEDGTLLELLTARELDVLRLLALGHSNAAIGESLGVSPGTAKWHVANVLGKLGTSSRTRAAARARELGLV